MKQPPPKLDRDDFKDEVKRPIALKPDDALNLRDRHQKALFHGYLKARWGFMLEFNRMYNEGLALLSSHKVAITLERMDKFMAIMRDTYYPGEEPCADAILPQAFTVVYAGKEITMTIAQVCRNWPILLPLASDPNVDEFSVVLDSVRIAVKRLPQVELESIK